MNSDALSQNNLSKVNPPNTFIYHHDSGHGWLEVPYRSLVFLRIVSKITSYSYRQGDTVYLEEDMDATTFIRAYLKSEGYAENDFARFHELTLSFHDGDESFIRSLNRF